jgi:ribose 5-phosphate isomerase A
MQCPPPCGHCFFRSMSEQDDNKRRAALAAMSYLRDGIVLGIGTGSTVDQFIDALPHEMARIESVVSSSARSTERLEGLGIEVCELSDVPAIDLYVDGADEATKHRHLVKGGGGALTGEKVLAGAARRFVCIVDESKLVGHLGAYPLPIEVIPMARSFVSKQMIRAGGQPVWRDGFVTDHGNEIIDVHNLNITNPVEMEQRFNQIPGVVTVGLFANRPADVLLVGSEREVRTLA